MNGSPLSALDAIVVLGCRVSVAGGRTGAATRRTRAAAEAYRDTGARAVIASGGRRWDGVAEADGLAELLVELGVPRRAVVRELCSLSTLENAAYSAELLGAAGLTRVGVVTCDWHLPRALACFEAVGIRATGIAAAAPLDRLQRRGKQVLEAARTWLDRRVAHHWKPPQ